MRVLACGLCGSDVEKIGVADAGTVLGHEVVARDADGTRVALVHHLPVRRVRALPGRARVDLRARSPSRRSCPAASPSKSAAAEGVELPDGLDDATGTYVEPLACVLRGAERVPPGPRARRRARLRRAALRGGAAPARRRGLRHRCERPERAGRAPDGPVDAAVLCAPAAPLDAVAPGGTVLVFAAAGPVDLDDVYRRELTLTGSRSATPRHMDEARRAPPELDLPEPTVLPLERFAEGLELLPLRPRAQGRLHAVRALRFHGPGDLRLEDVPRPEPGPGRRARPGRGRAHRRHRPEDVPARPSRPARRAAEPVRARVLRHRRRDRQAGRRRQLGRGRRARRHRSSS